jgi:hypothetical protein
VTRMQLLQPQLLLLLLLLLLTRRRLHLNAVPMARGARGVSLVWVHKRYHVGEGVQGAGVIPALHLKTHCLLVVRSTPPRGLEVF